MKKVLTILLLCSMLSIQAYEPLTKEEADVYVTTVTYDDVLNLIIQYDYLEHTIPEVTFLPTTYVLMGENLLIDSEGMLISHGEFSYKIPIEQKTIYNFVEASNPTFAYALIFTIGVFAGGAIGYVIGVL